MGLVMMLAGMMLQRLRAWALHSGKQHCQLNHPMAVTGQLKYVLKKLFADTVKACLLYCAWCCISHTYNCNATAQHIFKTQDKSSEALKGSHLGQASRHLMAIVRGLSMLAVRHVAIG